MSFSDLEYIYLGFDLSDMSFEFPFPENRVIIRVSFLGSYFFWTSSISLHGGATFGSEPFGRSLGLSLVQNM